MKHFSYVVFLSMSVFVLAGCDSSGPEVNEVRAAASSEAKEGPGGDEPLDDRTVIEVRDGSGNVQVVKHIEEFGLDYINTSVVVTGEAYCGGSDPSRRLVFYPRVYPYVRSDVELELVEWTVNERSGDGYPYQSYSEDNEYVTYRYCIDGYSANVNYSFLNIVAAQPGAVYPSGHQGVDFQNGVEFQWSGTDSFTVGILWVYKKINGVYSDTKHGISVAGASSRVVSGLEGSTEYAWDIELIDTRDSSVRAKSARAYFRTKPTAPSLSGVIQEGTPLLTWTSVPEADRYRVRRIMLDSGETHYFETTGTEFWDSTAVVEESQTFSGAVSFDVVTIDSSGSESRPSHPKLYTGEYGLGS